MLCGVGKFYFVILKENFYMIWLKYGLGVFYVCCSDFLFVVFECGYKEVKEVVIIIVK